MMWLLGALGAVRKAAQAAWGIATRYPWQAALLVALLACGWLWMGWNKADRKTAAAWAVVAEYKEANAKATAWALAEKRAKETAATDIKESANAVLKTSLVAGQAATDRFFADNRCVRFTPAKGGGERADMPRPDSVAGQPERAGGDAELAAIDKPDLNACTTAALRLDNAVNVWAADMVAKGLAK